jgi:hypothetical protein
VAIQPTEPNFNPVPATNNASAYTQTECDAFYFPKNIFASLWISTFNTPLLIHNVRIEPVRVLMRFQAVRLLKNLLISHFGEGLIYKTL